MRVVSAKKNTIDIANYISNRIHRVKALRNKNTQPEIRKDKHKLIIEKLTVGANGSTYSRKRISLQSIGY